MTATELLPNHYNMLAPMRGGLLEAPPPGISPTDNVQVERGDFALLEYYPDGSLMKAKPHRSKAQAHQARGGGVRRPISDFPPAARRRLLERLSKFRIADINEAVLVTLTYPRNHPSSANSKHDLDLFLRRLKRTCPMCCAIWRLEYQRRGAPHYHLLVLGAPQLEQTVPARMWFDVVGSDDPRHLLRGVRLQKVRSVVGVRRYLAKRDTKIPSDHAGRFWGVVGNEAPYMAERRTKLISRREYDELSRTVRKLRIANARCDPNSRRRAARIRWLRNGGPWSQTISYAGHMPVEQILTSMKPVTACMPTHAPSGAHIEAQCTASTTQDGALQMPSPLSIGAYRDISVDRTEALDRTAAALINGGIQLPGPPTAPEVEEAMRQIENNVRRPVEDKRGNVVYRWDKTGPNDYCRSIAPPREKHESPGNQTKQKRGHA